MSERVIGLVRDVTAEAHRDYLETGLHEVVSAFAGTIKFLDLDLAAIFQTDSIATIDLNRLSAWAAGWAASHVRCEEWARLVKADRKMRAAGPGTIRSRHPSLIEVCNAEDNAARAGDRPHGKGDYSPPRSGRP